MTRAYSHKAHPPILQKLTGGDRRSTGRADEVAAEIVEDQALFDIVVGGLAGADPVLRMRAADALEKASRLRPELLQPHKRTLLDLAASATQQEVRWHVAEMLPRLELSDAERKGAVSIIQGYLNDKSKIVQVNAMQALVDFARQDGSLLPVVVEVLERSAQSDSPAARARGRKLLRELGKRDVPRP